MSDVVPVDFGKEDREHARRFARLMGIVEAHEEDVLRNPGKHLKMAYEEVSRVRMAIENIRRDWWRNSRPPIQDYSGPIAYENVETIRVCRREWDALQEMRRAIEKLNH